MIAYVGVIGRGGEENMLCCYTYIMNPLVLEMAQKVRSYSKSVDNITYKVV